MGISISNSGPFPSLADIMNLTRGIVNDSNPGITNTPGEGNIITNSPTVSPFTLQFLNSAIREVFLELRNVGDPALIKDNVIISGLTPVWGANGQGGIDPAVQTQLSTAGYFDGHTINNALLLPSDMLAPIWLWERKTDSNLPFVDMHPSQDGIPPLQQSTILNNWEWRGNTLWFPGATTTRDIRIRYRATFPTSFSSTLDYSNTLVPIQDCEDAVAYKVALRYATMLGSPLLEGISNMEKTQMFQLKNASARRSQSIEYHRKPFGHSGNDNSDGYGWGY